MLKILRILAIVLFFLGLIFSAPPSFPLNKAIAIEKGQGQKAISAILKDHGVISSRSIFNLCVTLNNKGEDLKAGVYVFDRKLSVCEVARKIYEGDFGNERLTITIPEGFDSNQIAQEIVKRFPDDVFDLKELVNELKNHEGYLFPDTYYFFGNESVEEIVQVMKDNFDQKSEELKNASERSWEDIVIMASIIEKEANDEESRRLVSGILWKRLDNDMALQVDAPFVYERNLDSYSLSIEDLEKDSLYNTYTRRGLTPTAISNPGFDALYASVYPATSSYWYFLTDKEGNMYYAKTFEEHKKNKERYLR